MKKKIAIIGGGPAGLALAYKLLDRKSPEMEVIIIEAEPMVGGIGTGFDHKGIHFDYGSHRLHPSTKPVLMDDIKNLLGDDLLDMPRNGRIRMMNRFIKFPLKPFNFLFKMPPSFTFGVLGNIFTKKFDKKKEIKETFATVLEAGLGKTICRNFYFPYAKKLWGMEPDQIAAVQARRRVAAGSIGKIIKKVLSVIIPAFKKKGAGRFFYPKQGFVEIFEKYMMAIRKKGGQFMLANRVIGIEKSEDKTLKCVMEDGAAIDFDMVLSTMPVTELVTCLGSEIPENIGKAAEKLDYRGMVFCYMMVNKDQFTPYDAHYFPEEDLIFSRLSESKNYSAAKTPEGITGLCAEIPCSALDKIWNASPDEIFKLVAEDLKRIGLSVEGLVTETFTRRIRYAYPMYTMDFEKHLQLIHSHLETIPGLVVMGRQGLFAHDNIHHTMEGAYKACDCLDNDGNWDKKKWKVLLEEFKHHVVED